MPTAIRHGPTQLGGGGMVDLVTVRNTSKINHIIQHLCMGRNTGKMIKIALEWAQVIAGTTTPILEASEVLPHLTQPWIKRVHEFLVKYNSGIQVRSLTPQRVCQRLDQ